MAILDGRNMGSAGSIRKEALYHPEKDPKPRDKKKQKKQKGWEKLGVKLNGKKLRFEINREKQVFGLKQ